MSGVQAYLAVAPTGAASAKAHADFLELGLEGSVCKRRDSRYTPGRGAHVTTRGVPRVPTTHPLCCAPHCGAH